MDFSKDQNKELEKLIDDIIKYAVYIEKNDIFFNYIIFTVYDFSYKKRYIYKKMGCKKIWGVKKIDPPWLSNKKLRLQIMIFCVCALMGTAPAPRPPVSLYGEWGSCG